MKIEGMTWRQSAWYYISSDCNKCRGIRMTILVWSAFIQVVFTLTVVVSLGVFLWSK